MLGLVIPHANKEGESFCVEQSMFPGWSKNGLRERVRNGNWLRVLWWLGGGAWVMVPTSMAGLTWFELPYGTRRRHPRLSYQFVQMWNRREGEGAL